MSWKDKMFAQIQGYADEVAAEGAKEFERILRENLTRKTGTPSNPGEYPAKQTGELVQSIRRRRRVGNKIEHSVAVEARHAEILEKVRPFFKRTITESKDRVLAAMARAAKRRGLK